MPDQQLRGIRVYELDENRELSSIIYARHAMYQDDEWLLKGIKRSDISTSGVKTTVKKQIKLKRLILLELFSVLELESKDMSAYELLTYSDYLKENNLDNNEYLMSFWIKIFTPLTCLAMLLIAMPIVFATKPRSGGAGQRVVLAVVIGIIYFVINRAVNHLGLAMGFAPLLSASVPLILVTIVSIYFMRRVN